MNEKEKLPITDLVVDADQTLWDWVAMHAPGIEAMASLLSRRLEIPIEEIRASMGKVYKRVAAMDFDGLLQNMDVVIDRLVLRIMKGYQDPNVGAYRVALEYMSLLKAVEEEYQAVRKQSLKLYPNVRELFEVLHTRVNIHVLTDAPADKAVSRIKRLEIEKYITSLFGQPNFKLIPDPSDDSSEASRYIQHLQLQVRDHVPEHQEDERRRRGFYQVPFRKVELYDQKKPNVDLARLLNKTREEVSQCVAVWGDSPKSDMGLAANNGCRGFFATYGESAPEHVAILNLYGNPKGVNRDINSNDLEIRKIRERMGDKLIKVGDPIEILDHLNIPRPEK